MGAVEVQFLPVQVVAEHLRSAERQAVQVVDVRDDDFDEGGHICGAMNLTVDFFREDSNIDGLIKGLISQGKKRIIFHCTFCQQRGPYCAERFASRLEQAGSQEIDYVNLIQGGYKQFCRMYINEPDLVELNRPGST
mmetsp:Transcript_20942/g.58080  ORF Transcript_20942/g.58080 Transcript_20942/m.58080 type:complete len:137 (-) Transcript_20942:109-519(-)